MQQLFSGNLHQQFQHYPSTTTVNNNNLSTIHEVLSTNRKLLENCGWYHGKLSWSESANLLRNSAEGTFLVRDSADSRFLYTLSVQRATDEGPTSVRIHFSHGKFRLDADENIEHFMPKFDSVLALIEHYQELTNCSKRAKSHVWIDQSGQKYSPICLKKPLRQNPPSLAHCARLTVHQNLKNGAKITDDSLALPNRLSNYLLEYPHKM
jgi:hypothetical protein